jgi:hypothetical protein
MQLPAGDENFNEDIVRGLLRRIPGLDFRLVREAGLLGAEDPEVLAWAAREGRILLTHDRATMPDHAYARVCAGEKMPGVIVVNILLPVGKAIEALETLLLCSLEGEWEGKVGYLPL